MPELTSISGGAPEQTSDERATEAAASALTKILGERFKKHGIDPQNFEDRRLIFNVYKKFVANPEIDVEEIAELGDLAPIILQVIKEESHGPGPSTPAAGGESRKPIERDDIQGIAA